MRKTTRYTSKPGQSLSVLGAPLSLGQLHRGVELAPEFLRQYGLIERLEKLGWHVDDQGDFEVAIGAISEGSLGGVSGTLPSALSDGLGEDRLKRISLYCWKLSRMISLLATEGQRVLTLGGDHSVAVASISGLLEAHPDLGVVWVDAHGDVNTPETSPTGNFHGMPVAALLGERSNTITHCFDWLSEKLSDTRIAFVGVRSIDPGEAEILRRRNIMVYTSQEVQELGMARVAEEVLAHLKRNGAGPLHVSFDIDSLDPEYAPATGTAEENGLSLIDAKFLCQYLSRNSELVGLDMVEINPSIAGRSEDVERTMESAIQVVQSAFALVQPNKSADPPHTSDHSSSPQKTRMKLG